jgi:hypothetical protein
MAKNAVGHGGSCLAEVNNENPRTCRGWVGAPESRHLRPRAGRRFTGFAGRPPTYCSARASQRASPLASHAAGSTQKKPCITRPRITTGRPPGGRRASRPPCAIDAEHVAILAGAAKHVAIEHEADAAEHAPFAEAAAGAAAPAQVLGQRLGVMLPLPLCHASPDLGAGPALDSLSRRRCGLGRMPDHPGLELGADCPELESTPRTVRARPTRPHDGAGDHRLRLGEFTDGSDLDTPQTR